MHFIDMLGFGGLVLLLSAFVLNQFKIFSTESMVYHWFNFIGAYILAYYAYFSGNLPFIILETVWGSFSLIQLIRLGLHAGRDDSI